METVGTDRAHVKKNQNTNRRKQLLCKKTNSKDHYMYVLDCQGADAGMRSLIVHSRPGLHFSTPVL